MRATTRTGSFAVAAAAALLLAACGGDDDGDGGGAAGTEGGDGPVGTVSVNSTEPQNPLIPTATNEVGGGNIVDAMWTGLVAYDSETAEPQLAVADVIEPNDDFTEYTVTIQGGWTFHDGSPVTAQSFVDAWNFGAYGPNGQLNQYFFGPDGINITGYEEVSDADSPAAETMSGLEVVDDLTFTVALDSPNPLFETIVGYSAFYPMPESFFEDQAAFEANPIGNGPFQFVEHNVGSNITLEAYPDYAGETQPAVEQVEYRIYADLDAAYADVVANNLDVLDKVPPSGLAGEQWKADLEGRFGEEPLTTRITTITFPLDNTDQWQDPNLRKAFSMAIDRQTVTDTAYGPGAYVPATGWVPPGNEGYVEGACGEWCNYDPEAAKDLWSQVDNAPDAIQIATNADGGHQQWVEAACTSISNALDIQCTGAFDPDFGTFRSKITNPDGNEITGPFRTGWVADYPSIQNFLAPLYATGASANDGGYSNEEFDALIREAITKEGDEANSLYNDAEALLAEGEGAMSVVPLWYDNGQRGWSDRINEPLFTWKGYVDPMSLSVKSD